MRRISYRAARLQGCHFKQKVNGWTQARNTRGTADAPQAHASQTETGRTENSVRPACAGIGRGETPARNRKGQAAFEIFSAARLMRPEIGANVSLASLVTASVFFEP